jgi:hypothetical protein
VKNGDRAAEVAGNDRGVTVAVAADAIKFALLIYLIFQLTNALIDPTDQGVVLFDDRDLILETWPGLFTRAPSPWHPIQCSTRTVVLTVNNSREVASLLRLGI